MRFVLATHWHDDHIDGLAETLEACPNAMFGCSMAFAGDEFAAVMLACPPSVGASGVREMRRCFEIAEKRPNDGTGRPAPKRVIEHQNVWWRDDEALIVFALAPTSQAIDRAEHDIINTLLPEAMRRRRLGRITRNQASVVVTLRSEADSVLLGGDLEERGSGGSGWEAVVARFPAAHPRSRVFKVPHHGSDNAHHDGQWNKLLIDSEPPIAILTTHSRSGLPRPADLRRILERTKRAYLCGHVRGLDVPISRTERKAIANDGVDVKRPIATGQVRLRRKIHDPVWSVKVIGNAVQVDDEICAERPRPKTRKKRKRTRK